MARPETKPLTPTDAQHLFEDIEDDVTAALVSLKADKAKMIQAMTDGNAEQNKANAKVFMVELNKLQETSDENFALLRRRCPGIDRGKKGQVRDKITEYEKLLRDLKIAANYAGVDAVSVPLLPNHGAPKVTKISPLKLPTFAGNYAKYKSFKESFNLLIDAAGVEENMIGHRLHDCLLDEAREFVGADNTWLGKHKQLWRKLDGRYANRWTMTSEILKSSILSQPPSDFMAIKKWVDDQLDSIQRVLHLGLTSEQLIVNCILVKLPEYIASPVRLSLKTSGAGGGDYKFSPQEFEDAINETIQTWTPKTPELVQSLTVNHTSVNQKANPQDVGTIPSASGGPVGNGKKRGKITGRGGFRGSSNRHKCKLCNGDHSTKFCQSYKGSLAKRDRLKALGKCPECSWERHDDSFCRLQYPCNNCTGGSFHLDYLCPCIAQVNSPVNSPTNTPAIAPSS